MKQIILLPLITLLFLTCDAQEQQELEFTTLLEEFYEEGLRLSPLVATFNNGDHRYNDQIENDISPQYQIDYYNYYDKYEKLLKQINRNKLSVDDQMSYDVLAWECEINKQWSNQLQHLMPLNQLWCMPITMAQLGSGNGGQPFVTMKDHDNWLKRLEGYEEWLDTAIANMRMGIRKNVTLPKILVEKMLPQYERFANTPLKDHHFYAPVLNLHENFNEQERKQIEDKYQRHLKRSLIPKFKLLYKFLHEEYLTNCRTSHGLTGINGGNKYYDFLIKLQTTTNLSADAIHNIGLQEVERIRAEMLTIKNEIGYEGDLISFFDYVRNSEKLKPFTNAEEVLARFEKIRKLVQPEVDRVFNIHPSIPMDIKRVEAYREAGANAHYIPGTSDGSRAGIFYVPIPNASEYNIYMDESLYLHEAIPGHHYQASIALENESIPTFRKYVWYGAYGEGWALYCESLGKELGLLTDPYQYFGMLSMEMHRALRLVIDTGIHGKGWTREYAIEYSLQNEAIAEDIITSEVERYMAIPGQALSYKIGQLKIIELRNFAETTMGEEFDLKEFHTVLLDTGALPLHILTRKVHDWVKSKSEDN